MQFTITTIILILTILINGSLLYVVNKDAGKIKKVNQIFTLNIMSIIGWGASILLIIWLPYLTDENTYTAGEFGYTIEKIIFFFGALLVITNFWFAYYFTHQKLYVSVLTITTIILQGTVLLLTLLNNVFYTSVTILPEGFALLELQPLNGIYALFLLFHLVAPPIILLLGRRHARDKRQASLMKLLAGTYSLFLVSSITLNWILPVYFGIFAFNALGPTLSLIVVAGVAYAIIQHQFLNIKIAIQRGVIYTTLFAFIVLVYSSLLNVSAFFFDDSLFIDDFVSSLLTTIIGISTIPRLDSWLRTQTDPIFFKGQYDYREALHALSESLYKNIEMDKLVSNLEQQLQETLRSESVTLSQTPPKDAADRSLTVPVAHNNSNVGYIIIGPKRSGEAFTTEDQQLLNTFAVQASTAIGRALLYQEVKEYAEELEQKVTDRTVELQTLQEKQRDMMLYISHDLQTPLTIFQTKLEKLKQIAGHTEIVESLETSLLDLSRFITQLLRYAKLETGREEFELTEGNASEFMHELLDEVQIIADAAGVTVIREITPNITMSYDQSKMREVIMNVASNAIKYRDPEKNNPYVKFTTSETETAYLCTIEDNGLGIDSEDLPHIFEHFYRVKNTGTIKGTGLGLAVVHELIALSGGSITATSTIGSGTCFSITIPKANYQAVLKRIQPTR